ncbi:S8 family peptidase [Methylomonas rivi]|uniref:S8 family serine peptidase n=1 Tax=Methylomonas rivi TaxID=2952226 RepID=A0ABT1U905_9GAMM|nr:S8 family serine peptidase [Methylomonas sp. WSC-6]MCQ8130272.1 S8 family serine peptidase [Methylomonas sp. WSC-6]
MLGKRLLSVLVLSFVAWQATWAAQVAEFTAYRHKMPADLETRVSRNPSLRLIVRYYDAAVDREIQDLESEPRQDFDYKARLTAIKAERFSQLKDRTKSRMDIRRFKVERDYSHLPMNVVTIAGSDGLLNLVADPAVAEVYEDIALQHFLAQSAPLIKSTDVLSQTGYDGANTTVVVLDTGVNYALTDFGNCSAAGQPATCRVVVAQDLAAEDNALDDDGHGTNVSGIVGGVAKGTKLAVFDVFDGDVAYSSVVIAGINWAIANQLTYNISSINMSLGDASQNASQCSSKFSNPYITPINNAFSAGILTVIASGNSGFSAGLAMPACTPKAVSVGAVYDSNVGGLNWSICTDSTTSANKITCFSNSAAYLSLLAPGAKITAAGYTMGGTSQAAPHVAAAVAILRGARPSETITASLNRLTSTGLPITDTRNNLTFPRIDVLTALGSVNNDFADAAIISNGTTSQTVTTYTKSTSTQFADKETGEPDHTGNAGGKSVWFEWIAPSTGIANLNTHGSNFDTLLAVYTGTDVGALSALADNDNDGSGNNNSGLAFTAIAGTSYKIAVDGYNGAYGQVVLNVQFDSSTELVPFMPAWSLLLMALGLMGIAYRFNSRHA